MKCEPPHFRMIGILRSRPAVLPLVKHDLVSQPNSANQLPGRPEGGRHESLFAETFAQYSDAMTESLGTFLECRISLHGSAGTIAQRRFNMSKKRPVQRDVKGFARSIGELCFVGF